MIDRKMSKEKYLEMFRSALGLAADCGIARDKVFKKESPK